MAQINEIQWTKLTQVLNDFADYFIQTAKDNLTSNGSIATGDLYDSFEKIIDVQETHFSVSISLNSYWDYVEKGRRAGKFPPIDRIRQWIEVKHIKPYPTVTGKLPTVQQLTYLISRKIATEGIDAKPFFEPAKEDALARFELAIELAIDEDVSNYIEELVEKQILYEGLFGL